MKMKMKIRVFPQLWRVFPRGDSSLLPPLVSSPPLPCLGAEGISPQPVLIEVLSRCSVVCEGCSLVAASCRALKRIAIQMMTRSFWRSALQASPSMVRISKQAGASRAQVRPLHPAVRRGFVSLVSPPTSLLIIRPYPCSSLPPPLPSQTSSSMSSCILFLPAKLHHMAVTSSWLHMAVPSRVPSYEMRADGQVPTGM